MIPKMNNCFVATVFCGTVFAVSDIGCRKTSSTLQDCLHLNISVKEFRIGKSTSIAMGQTLTVSPGRHDLTFKFDGDETMYELAADPEVSLREIYSDGSVGNSSIFPCTTSTVEIGGETCIIIFSSIVIDNSLRAKNACIEFNSGTRTLIARKSLFVLP